MEGEEAGGCCDYLGRWTCTPESWEEATICIPRRVCTCVRAEIMRRKARVCRDVYDGWSLSHTQHNYRHQTALFSSRFLTPVAISIKVEM